MADPSVAVARALRGKRTGIIFETKGKISVDNETGMEDVDEFWNSTRSPSSSNNQQQGQSNNNSKKKKNNKKKGPLKQNNHNKKKDKAKQQPMKPRFSIGSSSSSNDNNSVENKSNNTNIKSSNNNPKFLSRAAVSSNIKKVKWSPSDLSHVSTAPPTPLDTADIVVNNDNNNSSFSQSSMEEEEEDIGRVSQKQQQQEEDDDNVVEEIVQQQQQQQQQQAEELGEFHPPVSPPEATRGDVDDDDDDDDDLIPPPPPDEEDDNNDEQQIDKSNNNINNDDIIIDNDNDAIPISQSENVEIPIDVGGIDNNSDMDLDDDDDGDGDDGGAGFTLVHDPETPEDIRTKRIQDEQEEIQKQREKTSNSTSKDNVQSQSPEEEKVLEEKEEEESTSEEKKIMSGKKKRNSITPILKRKTKKRNTKKKVTYFSSPIGYPAGPREYHTIPVSDFKDASPEDKRLRRSKRAKIAPLAYWKNERQVYEAHDEDGMLGEAMGDMPVVTGVLTALPTPYKKRKVPTNNIKNAGFKKSSSRRNSSSTVASDETYDDTPFDDRKLKKKYNFVEDDKAHLWDEVLDDAMDTKVISRADTLESTKLPLMKRRKGEGKEVGRAAQAFNIATDEGQLYPGYIMGNLVLPPKGIKDAEATGGCSQTFTVCNGQPNALEVAYSDPHDSDGVLDPETAQRFLLSPGDMFRIPPGNSYRIENHSKTRDCLLTWTIIRPREAEE